MDKILFYTYTAAAVLLLVAAAYTKRAELLGLALFLIALASVSYHQFKKHNNE
jgi:hypothetical protein